MINYFKRILFNDLDKIMLNLVLDLGHLQCINEIFTNNYELC